MDQVDFGYVGSNEFTIYNRCFQRYINTRFSVNRPQAEWEKLVTETEKLFDFLVKEGTKREFDVDSILEIPSSNGSTCFNIASGCSEKIASYIIERGIKVDSIETNMTLPDFKFADLAVSMMTQGINPHVINNAGYSGTHVGIQSKEAHQLWTQFPRSIHFSIEDISCENTCLPGCPSKFKRFYYKNGEIVEMRDANRIGQGGFGSVFKGSFHGKDKAMKFVLIGHIEDKRYVSDAISDLEKNISEIRIQVASSGSGIVVPEAFVRQQNQERDDDGNWIARNYNVFIYPLYDCNVYELHSNNFDQFTETIIADIIHQCFVRPDSLKSKIIKFE